MDPDDKLKRIMQQSGLFEESDGHDDIGDYSASSEDEWTPDIPDTKKIKILTDINLSASHSSFQPSKRNNKDQSNSHNEQPSSSVNTLRTDFSHLISLSDITTSNNEPIPSSSVSTSDTVSAHLPSLSGNPPKKIKLSEKSGLFESDDDTYVESDDTQESQLILNPETGLFEVVEIEIEPSARKGKKRVSRRDEWERTKTIKRNLKNHKLEELPACRCKCKDKLSKKQIQTTFNKFINLQSHTEQNLYLQGCLQEVNPKRYRPRKKENATSTTRTRRVFEYAINLPKQSINVCQKVFLAIHGIKRERLVCKVQHQEKDVRDGRGRQSNPQFDAESVKKVHAFIENLPARQSHYCRTSSNHRRYLDSHLCIAELHRKFCLDHPESIVSYEKFRSIFNHDFNISFGQPRKDICTMCEKFKVDIISAELAKDNNKVKQLKCANELHLRKAEVFLKSLSTVEKERQSNKLSLCFDFQKNMPLPVTNITDEYYLRQLWMHNFGVHNLCKNTATMFLFTENYAHKGPNEVITALEYYITKQKSPNQHELDLYCDNCYSQNKNRYLFTYLDQLCVKGKFEKITISYPIPGHSMMPIDRDFALIERKKKKYDKIHSPEDYVKLIKDSKNVNKFDIVFIEKSLMKENGSEDVLKVKDYKKLYDERIKVNLPGISKCRKVIFKKIGKPEYAMSMTGQDFKQFSLYKTGFSRLINEVPENCYDAPLTVKAAKVKDVKRLLEYVPEAERYFYEDLINDNRDPVSDQNDSADEIE